MKVLHVITSLVTAGAEHLLVDLLPLLRDKGVNVEICVFNGTRFPFYEQLEQTGIKIHKFGVKDDYYNPLHIYRLGQLMRGFDIVHTHNTSPQLFAALASRLVKTKLITTEHNTSNRRRNKSWLRPIDKWMYRQYDRIICISDQTELLLRDHISDYSGKISTIYNGIDLSKYHNAVHSTFQQLDNMLLICMISAFRWEKDQQTLIRAVGQLPEKYHLLLVGGGDEFLVNQCKALAVNLGIGNRVHFMGVRNDVPSILKSVTLYVQSSHIDGFCLAAVEAMAAGLPTIVSDIPGLSDVIGDAGLKFPHADSVALANAILKVGEDPVYARLVANNCVERAQMFDISIMTEKYNYVYQECLR